MGNLKGFEIGKTINYPSGQRERLHILLISKEAVSTLCPPEMRINHKVTMDFVLCCNVT